MVFGLAALRLIIRKSEAYVNSDSIEELFTNNEWHLFRTMVSIQAHIMYMGQADYVDSLKTCKNVGVRRFAGKGKTIYEKLGHDAELRKVFYDYMEAYSEFANPHLIQNVDFSRDHAILDVGGGVGANAIALAKHNPALHVTLLDLLVAASLAKEKIEKNGLSARIDFHPCDIFKQPFPKNYDSILFAHQLVIWGVEENKCLLKKAYNSLNENGRVIIFSSISEDSEDSPLMAALDTVYFRAVAAGDGMIYPWKDYENWLKEAGFKRMERIPCNMWTPHGIVIAYK